MGSGLTETIRSIRDIDGIDEIIAATLRAALPIPFRKQKQYTSTPAGLWRANPAANHASEITVAFVSFEFEGRLVSEPQVIVPNRMHDLTIAVTVSEWPPAADTLVVDVLSVEPRSTYEFPTFRFARPVGSAPY